LWTARDHWFSYNNSCLSLRELRPTGFNDDGDSSYSILFVHGRLGHGEIWSSIVENLAHQYRCFLLDLPGYGRSFSVGRHSPSLMEYANLLVAVVEKFSEKEKVILVGHDVGGGLAQLSTVKVPSRVAALVLVNSACISRRLGKIKIGIQGLWVRQMLKKMLKNVPKEKTEMLLHPWCNRLHRQSLAQSLKALSETWPWHYEQKVWRESLKHLSQPVLLLWGENDSINPPEIGMELMQGLPEAYFFLNKSCGHLSCLEEPDWILSKMKDFLFKVSFNSKQPAKPTPFQKSLLR